MKLTILTPSYNREKLLKRCYASLLAQINKNFEWLIVDDGSTDNTEEVVRQFIDENKMVIKYIYKKNGGKHTAVNLGVKNITSDLTLLLDSDDYLTEDAVEQIYRIAEKYSCEQDICGYTFLKKYPDGMIMGDKFPRNGRYNFIDWRVNGVVSGDQCDVFYTKCMHEYPFSEYPGEKFIGESTSWIRMAEKYDMICENTAIYIAEYLEGGLTKEGRAMRIKNPNGGMEYANLCMIKRCSIKRKFRSAILYTAYARINRVKYLDMLERSNNKLLTIVMNPLGLYMARKWNRDIKG